MRYCVEKGSIALDGISLTIAKLGEDTISVSMIPHTMEHTNFGKKKLGDLVNLENDMVGKYVEKLLQVPKEQEQKTSGITMETLLRAGF